MDFGVASTVTVEDFAHDLTGHFRLPGSMTYTQDQGGVIATGYGTTVDFHGFHSVTELLAKVES